MGEKRPTDTEVAAIVKQFRETLMNAGFRHANGAGELVSGDDTTWIGTQYSNKEYSIYAWRRPRGHGEIGEVRHVMRVMVGTHDADGQTEPETGEQVAALARRLVRWANKPPARGAWPVPGLEPLQ